jgi:hypothetical protein
MFIVGVRYAFCEVVYPLRLACLSEALA